MRHLPADKWRVYQVWKFDSFREPPSKQFAPHSSISAKTSLLLKMSRNNTWIAITQSFHVNLTCRTSLNGLLRTFAHWCKKFSLLKDVDWNLKKNIYIIQEVNWVFKKILIICIYVNSLIEEKWYSRHRKVLAQFSDLTIFTVVSNADKGMPNELKWTHMPLYRYTHW